MVEKGGPPLSLDPQRVEALLEAIEEAAGGNFSVRFPVSEAHDDVDAIGYAVNIMAEELQDTIARLEATNQELAEFVYAASHDLKAPLRSIGACADFLREDLKGSLEAEQEGYLNNISQLVRRGQNLIDDLLHYTQVGQTTPQARDISLSELVATLTEVLADDIDVQVQEGLPKLKCDLVLLTQILDNLIANASKYSRADRKRVEIGSTLAGDQLRLFVRDNGIGIESRHHERIFRLFQRLHGQEEFGGSGIGLAIVRKAASRLGGSVEVESELGQGSTFWVSLPRDLLA